MIRFSFKAQRYFFVRPARGVARGAKGGTGGQKTDFLLFDGEHGTADQSDFGDPYDPRVDLKISKKNRFPTS